MTVLISLLIQNKRWPIRLFDAVAVLLSPEGAAQLSTESTAKDFVSDAFSHLKFIGFNSAASDLFAKANVATSEEGVIQISSPNEAAGFVNSCRKLRIWDREKKVKMSSL